MTHRLVLDTSAMVVNRALPSLNEYLGKHHQARAKIKRESQLVISNAIRKQLPKLQVDTPVMLHFSFYKPNSKRDIDNISGVAHKLIIDSLVQCKVLKDDSQRYVTGLSDMVFIDKTNPRIEVEIEERKEVKDELVGKDSRH